MGCPLLRLWNRDGLPCTRTSVSRTVFGLSGKGYRRPEYRLETPVHLKFYYQIIRQYAFMTEIFAVL